MIAYRRTCINVEERTEAISFNTGLIQAGERYTPRQPVPEPLFRDDRYSFKLDNVQSYYEENTKEKDIIMNLAYDGVVRLV